MIGEARVRESFKAQMAARGITVMQEFRGEPPRRLYFTSSMHGDNSLDASAWAANAIEEVAGSTARTGNHVCRPDVCHKGRIGRMGFCRMFYWHWARSVDDKKRLVAKRYHGLDLTPRWNGVGAPPLCASPPFTGAPALEITHPFHFKMCPAMLLGPMCNHDLGVLL